MKKKNILDRILDDLEIDLENPDIDSDFELDTDFNIDTDLELDTDFEIDDSFTIKL